MSMTAWTTYQEFLLLYQTAVLKNPDLTLERAVRMLGMAMQIENDRLCAAIRDGKRTLAQCALEAYHVHLGIMENSNPTRQAWMELRYKPTEWDRLEDYEKEVYEIKTKDGEIVTVWPNAGFWNELLPSDRVDTDKPRQWEVGTVVARLPVEHPLDKED